MAALWDVSGGVYASKSLSVTSQETSPYGLAFSADGTKAYITGNANDTIFQYTLGTAWDISTGSYASKSMSVTAQDTSPLGLAFSSDGTKAYIVGNTNDTIYQYGLTTAWDISTGSYASKSMSVAGQDTQPYGLAFSADGTKAYIVGITSDTIYQYGLTTAWDISTGSYASKSMSVAGQDTQPLGLAFSADGTSAYITGTLGSVTIYQYTLSTAWDISTGSYASKSLLVSTQAPGARNMAFSSLGDKLYVIDVSSDAIYQYTLISSYVLTGTVTDPSGTAIASADVLVINTTTNPYTVDATATADGSGVYTAIVLSNTDTYQVVSSAVGPPRRFGASDNNLTAT